MEDYRLIYVLKIGYKSNGKGLYEFIFSKDTSNIEAEKWGWNEMPAFNNATPPTQEYIDTILSLETDKVDLNCLHELNDRAYMDGYYTIHALAYQNLDDESSDLMYDELPIMVFHYGMKLKEVQDILYTRDLIFKSSIPEKKETTIIDIDDEDDDDMGINV